MKYLFWVFCLILLLFTVTCSASAQEVVPIQDQARINALIDKTLKGGRSDVDATELISSTIKATIVPRPMISRATGQICDRCTDFCRDYLLKIELDGGLDTMLYSGRNCIVIPSSDPNSGEWAPARALTLTDRHSIIRSDLLSDAQSYLRQLQYLQSTQYPTTLTILSALDDFRSDSQLPDPGSYQVTEKDIASLRKAAANLTVAGACAPSKDEYTACGTLNTRR